MWISFTTNGQYEPGMRADLRGTPEEGSIGVPA